MPTIPLVFDRAAAGTSAATLVALVLLAGCSASAPTGGAVAERSAAVAKTDVGTIPVESGFLSDYATLAPSEQFPELRFYRDDSRKTAYRKLRFSPVEVWRGSDKLLTDVPDEDLQFLADSFYRAVHDKLAKSFEIVDEPAPGVLEIHLALTLVTDPESNVDLFTTEVPVRQLAPRSGALAPATMTFVRQCALEAEMFERDFSKKPGRHKKHPRIVRAAIFDVRRGSQTPKGNVTTWQDVRGVFDRWGDVLDERLTSVRDGTFKPRLTTKGQRQ